MTLINKLAPQCVHTKVTDFFETHFSSANPAFLIQIVNLASYHLPNLLFYIQPGSHNFLHDECPMSGLLCPLYVLRKQILKNQLWKVFTLLHSVSLHPAGILKGK